MPVYNAERFVRQALDSIYAQTYDNYEIVAVDGGSTDATPDIVRDGSRVRYLRQVGQGLADAWNSGLAASQGEYICFLDSDDLWPSFKLERQVDYLERHPEHQYVIGYVTLFLEAGCPAPDHFQPQVFATSHIGHMPGTLMARRELFSRLGGFGTEWQITPDIEWFARVWAEGVPSGVLPDVLLNKRIHAANLSTTTGPTLMRRELLHVLKQSLDRRRNLARSRVGQ
jgi:glycosyltransferase involved in cell wall biosynthesis